MSLKAYLVAHKSKHVLGVGKVLLREDHSAFEFTRANVSTDRLYHSIIQFLLDHVRAGVHLMTDSEFWDLDLEGYERVDEDYGIPFRGPRFFVEPDD